LKVNPKEFAMKSRLLLTSPILLLIAMAAIGMVTIGMVACSETDQAIPAPDVSGPALIMFYTDN
jgi:hypothetical protein